MVELAQDAMEVERDGDVPAGQPQLLQPPALHPNSAATEATNGQNGARRQAAQSGGQQQGPGLSQQAPQTGEQPQEAEEQAAARVKALLQTYDDKYKRYTKEVRQQQPTAQSTARMQVAARDNNKQ